MRPAISGAAVTSREGHIRSADFELAALELGLDFSGARAGRTEKPVERKAQAAIQLGVDIETLVIVSGLADDHAAVRAALTAAAKLVMPTAVVAEPVVPPEEGFALVLATPEPVTPADLTKLELALAAELDRQEILHADLAVELLEEA